MPGGDGTGPTGLGSMTGRAAAYCAGSAVPGSVNIVETKDLSFEAVGNPNVSRDSGAGIQAAQLVAEKGARFVVTGNCVPNAYRTLLAAGLGVIVGYSGAVRDVVESFKAGWYSAAKQPSVASCFGAGPTLDAAASSSPNQSRKLSLTRAKNSMCSRSRPEQWRSNSRVSTDASSPTLENDSVVHP